MRQLLVVLVVFLCGCRSSASAIAERGPAQCLMDIRLDDPPCRLAPVIHFADSLGLAPRRLLWTSSNPAVAAIDSTGLVFPRSVGTTRIDLRSGNAHSHTTLVIWPRGATPVRGS